MIAGTNMNGYYRAALAAAGAGDMTKAARLSAASAAFGEEAPSAQALRELLRQKSDPPEAAEPAARLRELVQSRQYKKALKIRLPGTSKCHAMRGLLYALLNRCRAARREFAAALVLDSGNETARRALLACRKTKWWD